MVQENTKTETTEVKGNLAYEDKVIQKLSDLPLNLSMDYLLLMEDFSQISQENL